jgi:hypothetical protein
MAADDLRDGRCEIGIGIELGRIAALHQMRRCQRQRHVLARPTRVFGSPDHHSAEVCSCEWMILLAGANNLLTSVRLGAGCIGHDCGERADAGRV